MFEKFLSANSQDFRQRYQGTFGFFVGDGQEELCQLHRIITDATPQYVEFRSADGREFYIRADSKHDRGFRFIPPKAAWYNTKDGVPLLVGRIPARQFLRGLCDRNTSITDFNQETYPIDFTTLTKLFLDKVSVSDALVQMDKVMCQKRGAGIAISPQFCVSPAFSRIKCFNATIGKCDYKDGTFAVSLEDPDTWLTEVTDAFRRAKLEATVK